MNTFPDIKKANETYGGGNSDFYKFEDGDNRIRILAIATEPVAKHFLGKKAVTCIGIKEGCLLHGENAPKDDKGKPRSPSIKYMAYIVDREDPSNIRLADLPYSVMKQLSDLRNDPDWAFEQLPVPYSVRVKYDPNAAGSDMYKLIPSPTRVHVAAEILEKLSRMKPLDEIVKSVIEKAMAETGQLAVPHQEMSDEQQADAALRAEIERIDSQSTDEVPF